MKNLHLNADKQQAIKNSVLLNDSILKITTPYMRFYELEALCALGEQDAVMKEMKAYWGGMLKEGATSFWEKYIPEQRLVDLDVDLPGLIKNNFALFLYFTEYNPQPES